MFNSCSKYYLDSELNWTGLYSGLDQTTRQSTALRIGGVVFVVRGVVKTSNGGTVQSAKPRLCLTPVSTERIKIRWVKEEGNLPPSIEGFSVLELVESLNNVIQQIEQLLNSTYTKTHPQYLIKSSPRDMEKRPPCHRFPSFSLHSPFNTQCTTHAALTINRDPLFTDIEPHSFTEAR